MRASCLTAIGLVASLNAQSPATAPAFEVASVKRNVRGGPSLGRTQPDGRFTATNAPVVRLISLAYDNLSPDRILNLPQWTEAERYDLVAKAPEGVQLGRMMGVLMQTLLRERFAFQAYFEKRQMPIYELVLARRDRRLGPKLSPSVCDCTGTKTEPGCRQGVPLPSIPEFDQLICVQVGAPGRRIMRGFPLQNLMQVVDGRSVVDKTGLGGTWNAELEFTRDERLFGERGLLPAPPPGLLPAPPDGAPSFFTAIQEQLGLKLKSSRGPVDVLVIDHVEPPTPD